jgi:hypothetical protein
VVGAGTASCTGKATLSGKRCFQYLQVLKVRKRYKALLALNIRGKKAQDV